MKLLPLIAAAGLAFIAPAAVSTAAAAPASVSAPAAALAAAPAQTRVRVSVGEQRRYQRRHHGRRHHARRGYWRNDCRTTWRNHRRVRVCHRVRGWR